MPFIPHTEDDIKEMLKQIGVKSISDLFDEIPPELKIDSVEGIPEGLSEMSLMRLMEERAAQTKQLDCYLGAGAYDHHIPAAVWDLANRGEFLTAYTPYQAEASQGNLQLMWEYQTMISSLMGMEVSNASLYDGASALAEAALMALRIAAKHKNPCIYIATTVHPFYRAVLKTILSPQKINLIEIPFDSKGIINTQIGDTLLQKDGDMTALIIPQPNFFGRLEHVDTLTDWAHEKGALVIGLVNPIAMAWLKPPGQWGQTGVDIACGEGQPLGVPLSGGGPYFGFLCTRNSFVRQMPGRLVGKTVDKANQPGYTLTLQAREQHIRRAKATSNICTNQGLLVTAATIYMSLLGPQGLKRVAKSCYSNMSYLIKQLTALPLLEPLFVGEHFHESAWRLQAPVDKVLNDMCQRGFAAGYQLKNDYPQCGEALLICITETKTKADIDEFVKALADSITRNS